MIEAVWQAPPELLRSSPRPVGLTAAGKAVAAAAVVLAAGALGLGVWLYSLAGRDAAQREAVRNDAAPAEAEVVRLGRRGGKDRRRVVTYRYEIHGRTYQGRATLARGDRRSFELGSRIAIRYLPSDPQTSWMPGHEPKGVPMWLPAVVPLSLVAPAAVMALVLRRQKGLLENGRPAQARVTGSRRVHHGGAHGGHHAWRVEYEFTILSGATRRGSFDQAKNPPPAGTALTIVYDTEQPRRHARYPLCLVAVSR